MSQQNLLEKLGKQAYQHQQKFKKAKQNIKVYSSYQQNKTLEMKHNSLIRISGAEKNRS